MPRFRSKPVEIEAVQFKPHEDLPMETAPVWFVQDMLTGRIAYYPGDGEPYLVVETANGRLRAEPNDWIIREPSGIGAYPCKPDVFATKYEPVD